MRTVRSAPLAEDARHEAATPELVTLHLWRVRRRHVPLAVARMGLDRRVRRRTGVRFAKLMGTGDGRTFRVRDADPTRWALLVAWDSAADAADFEASGTVRGWGRLAVERLRLDLRPLSSRGRWSGTAPFGDPALAGWDGPVASLTRARVRPSRLAAFHRAVPAVSRDLQHAPGLRLALGVGDAPGGLLGTFSVWDSAAAARDFAYGRPAHRAVMRSSRAGAWFAEDLFAMFAVLDVQGSLERWAT